MKIFSRHKRAKPKAGEIRCNHCKSVYTIDDLNFVCKYGYQILTAPCCGVIVHTACFRTREIKKEDLRI